MRRVNDEGGTTVVLVAVLMGFLLTVVSFVVDTGRLLDEHGQLTNGADAVALGVATTCGRAPSSCTGAAAGLASTLAGANAADGVSHVEALDVRLVSPHSGVVLTLLRSQEPGQSGPDGAVSLSLAREGGMDTAPVRDGSAAAWGPVTTAPALPTVFSACDIVRILREQGGPFEGTPPPGARGSVVAHHDPDAGRDGDDDDEDDWPTCDFRGSTLDTGFAEIRRVGGCDALTSVDPATWQRREPGASLSSTRSCLERGAQYVVPVFDRACTRHGDRCPGSVGGRDGYRIAGLAAVVVTGWRLPGSTTSPAPTCPPDTDRNRCISVIVTRTVVPGVPIASRGTSPLDFGVVGVQLLPIS